jgi:hypothetical protein
MEAVTVFANPVLIFFIHEIYGSAEDAIIIIYKLISELKKSKNRENNMFGNLHIVVKEIVC